jgi:hypothetical protein
MRSLTTFRHFLLLPALAALALAPACFTDETPPHGGAGGTGGHGGHGGAAPVGPSFRVRGSVNQIHVWKAPPNVAVEVRDGAGKVVQSGTTDKQGSLVFRKLDAAPDYAVVIADAPAPNTASPVKVTTSADSQPPQSFYDDQKLQPGYQYLTTRDGTKLSAYITLPGKPEDGPYPTIVNYSGYDPSKPGQPADGYQAYCSALPVFCDMPSDASAMIASMMGYATVSVNIRGTGCSGGAYDYFEELQLLDGYDIVETVAAQPWVLGHRVGMTGLSYPGITQLFVARKNPPSLAAITPLSVIGGSFSTGRPGGIFNDGFALEWISNVLDKADPYGQGWEQSQVDKGDTVCEENQLLHSQKYDAVNELKTTEYYNDARAGNLDPTAFAHEIKVPVFLASAFQDEQTGPYFFTLLDKMTSSPQARFTVYNGVHLDGFAPQILAEWKAFLDIHVAHAVPSISLAVRQVAPLLLSQAFKATMQLPSDRFSQYKTWEEAKAAYDAEQPVRVIFEDGAGPNLGAPEGMYDKHFDAWPPPTQPLRLYFHQDGTLQAGAPTETSGASSFQLDPDAGHRGILQPGGSVWDPLPKYDWRPPQPGYDVIFDSAPMDADQVMLGSASVDLWVRSPVDDADLEVNLIEIRPDGQERYIQSGWLRASVRAPGPQASPLWPAQAFHAEDAKALVPGEWTAARVGVPAFAHVLRKGSRLRVTVDTPGDSRASWMFALKTFPGTVKYDVAHNAAYPSSVVLPVVPGLTAETPLPACPSLRGQQCRDFVAYTNVAAAP